MENRIVIIDGNSLINRAYYAMQRPMITKDGIYTQGIYGFINMLNKIKTDYEPGYLTVAFDLKAPTFRHLEYDQYKAGRKAMPPELVMQMPLLKDVLHAMNIKTLEMEGFEADDIIGTVAREGEEQGLCPMIITGDKDALQLATDKTQILITKKGISEFELFDHEKMLERYELTPQQFIDLKGLMGDSSDNIPGIPGVGEKTGITLLKQFGSVENLIVHTEEISKPALRKKVEENMQLAVMSKRLATINRYVPIEISFNEMKIAEPDYDQLIELYTKLEFNSFLKKLSDKKTKTELTPQEVPDVKMHILRNETELENWKLQESCGMFLKVFSDFNHVQQPDITGIFLMGNCDAWYINCDEVSAEMAVSALNRQKLSLWGHDIKDDLYALTMFGFSQYEVVYDTAIAEYVLDVSRNSYDLKSLAFERLHVEVEDAEDYITGSGQLDMFTDKTEKYASYGAICGGVATQLRKLQEKELTEKGLERVFYEAELPLIEVLADMEAEGIRADKKFLDDFGTDIQENSGAGTADL